MLSERSEHETEEEKRKKRKQKVTVQGAVPVLNLSNVWAGLLLFGQIMTRKQLDSL